MPEGSDLQPSPAVRRRIVRTALALLLVAGPAGRAADLDIDTLRRQVRDLEHSLADVERRLDRLESSVRSAMPDRAGVPAAQSQAGAEHGLPRWIDVRRWDALRTGMTAQEIIAALGEPTAVRPGSDAAERILLYTLELDASAFLSGRVRIRADRVVAIERPVLR